MPTITIQTTDTLPPDELTPLREALNSYVEVEETWIGFKSLEKPTFIALVGSLEAWKLVLAGAVGLYLNEIIKQAAKDHWQDRSKIFNALKARTVKPVLDLAAAISRIRVSSTRPTPVAVALAWPDDFWGTRFFLPGRNQTDVAVELAAFLAHIEHIHATLSTLASHDVKPVPPIQIELLPDGVLQLRFIDDNTGKERCIQVPANAA